MDLKEYQAAIDHLMYKSGKLIPLEVCGLGLSGEVGELLHEAQELEITDEFGGDREENQLRILNEAGDILWYVTAIAKHFNIDVSTLGAECFVWVERDLVIESALLVDALKKQVWHDKPVPTRLVEGKLESILELVGGAVDVFCEKTLADAAQANVDKLKARWPSGFGVKS